MNLTRIFAFNRITPFSQKTFYVSLGVKQRSNKTWNKGINDFNNAQFVRTYKRQLKLSKYYPN